MIYEQMNSCFCKKSFFRLLNAYADFPVDVHVNEIVMGENIKLGGFTKYAQFNPGKYIIKIYKSNDSNGLIFESEISIEKNLAYTGIIAKDNNDQSDVCVLVIPEAKENCIKGNMSSVKLANLLMDVPCVDILVSDGTVWFSDIEYCEISNNVGVPSGKYNLELRDKKNNKNLMKIMNVDFAPKMHYTIYLIGNKSKSDIKIIIPQDGVNYLGLC